MSNLHYLFQQYNTAIKLPGNKRDQLILTRNTLRNRIQRNYLMLPPDQRSNLALIFQSQGSFVMDTIITPVNDDYDLDDGVYFKNGHTSHPRPQPKAFHEWVIRSVDTDSEYEQVTDKPTCVRVKFKSGFHIDLPIYYVDNFELPDLADTIRGWVLSNPVEFIAWFEDKTGSGFQKAFLYDSQFYAESYEKWQSDIRKQDCQLRRLVRYMKAWADLKRKEMPCGLIMTILVANNFEVSERDDVAFRDTLVNIHRELLLNGVKCLRPTSPVGEDLFANTSEADKKYFMDALGAIIKSANEAIHSADPVFASKQWKSHLGDRFPAGAVIPTVDTAPSMNEYSSLRKIAVASTPWCK